MWHIIQTVESGLARLILLISGRFIREFGVLITVSVVVATVYFGYAFISIWCYFAAVLSVYILIMFQYVSNTHTTRYAEFFQLHRAIDFVNNRLLQCGLKEVRHSALFAVNACENYLVAQRWIGVCGNCEDYEHENIRFYHGQ